MPAPDDMRLSWPGVISCSEPRLSRCRIFPSSSHVTVCRPICGCGPMSRPSFSVAAAGPRWSAKHQAPIVRRTRRGSARRTVTPPTEAVRESVISSVGVDVATSDVGASDVSATVTGPLMTAPPAAPGISQHAAAVHLTERVGDDLDPRAVRVTEVGRHVAVDHVLDTRRVELADQVAPAFRLDTDGHVVQAAQDLAVRADVEAGEVEERE